MKKIKEDWFDIVADIDELVRRLKPVKFQIRNIYGIPRGGLVIAVILSHKLEVPVITDIRKIGRNTLLVDDIADTGKTLKKVLKVKKPFAIATLWYHPQSVIIPDYYIQTKDKDWIVFPWETITSSKYDKTV